MDKIKYKFQMRMNMFQWIWYIFSGNYCKDVDNYNKKWQT